MEGAKSHDAMYEAFFAAVGTRPNESHEKLLDLLPSVREQQAERLRAPATPEPKREAIATDVHPMRKEWLDAAGEVRAIHA